MPNPDDKLDLVFTALADHNRRAMIERLSRRDQSVSALAAPLGISLPATLQHLGILESAGLVHSSKMGRVRTCRLDREALSAVEAWIGQRRAHLPPSGRLDALADLLTRVANREQGQIGT
ncbi:MAG: metalloregulator ArsR/SmtB family transcription factor [Alphaproteobacteria bacterium]|nr:metalloregulator ArsR/SmtB family transcription factor [Alphaproteobacteria bacterium]